MAETVEASRMNWIVEMVGEVRELYAVEADTADEARERWMEGERVLAESSSMEFHSVREDD
jgi:hypothetical protein